MNKDETLKLAKDGFIKIGNDDEVTSQMLEICVENKKRIEKALEQPAQELVAWTKSIDKALETLEFYVGSVDTSTLHPHVKLNYEDFLSIVKSIKQFKNSIVNTNREIMYFGLSSKNEWIKISKDTFDFRVNNKRKMKLYTHPAPSWQGLNDDKIIAISNTCDLNHVLGLIDFARAIEQALKEKNHD